MSNLQRQVHLGSYLKNSELTVRGPYSHVNCDFRSQFTVYSISLFFFYTLFSDAFLVKKDEKPTP